MQIIIGSVGRVRFKLAVPLGALVADARRDQGLSQTILGERVGFSQSVVSRMETGGVHIEPEVIAAIAGALGSPGLLNEYCNHCPVCRELSRLGRGSKARAAV